MLQYMKVHHRTGRHIAGSSDLRRTILTILCSSMLGLALVGCSSSEPPPPAQYQVLFNSGHAALTPEGHQMIENVAAYVRTDPNLRVTIVGKTDTVGGPPENRSLSQQRAQMVRNALVFAGVPEGEMQTTWTGEGQLNVPTGNNVAEPRNRAVNIVVQ
jgi:OOP family OmpA-OmpF porin